MREIVREWVDKGNSDFIAAKTLAPKKGLENQTGFHCQQAIEKWLKAYLIKHGEEIRKIHDLTALVIDCEKYDTSFQDFHFTQSNLFDLRRLSTNFLLSIS